jgi:hypothetical protein
MSHPVVTPIAEEMYSSLHGWAAGDAARGWALLHLTNAIALQHQVIADVAFDDDAGNVGWSALFDIYRCPSWAIAWLGQFIGSRFPPSLTDEAAQRAWVKDAAGWRRGRPASLVAAVQHTLTGQARVTIRARFDPTTPGDAPGHIQIKTYTADTPNPAATEAAARLATRAFLQMHYAVVDGQDYIQGEATAATYTAASALYATYDAAADATT